MDPRFCAEGRLTRHRPLLLVSALMSLLAACSSGPLPTYDLGAIGGGFSAKEARRGQLAVYEPTAVSPVDSDRIVVRTGADSIAYLSGAKWADQLTSLVQARLIASFQNAHLFRAVGEPGIVSDYNLRTDIRRFELDVAGSIAFVEISAQLTGAGGRILAGKVFSASAPAPRDDGATVTKALDAALANVMRQIVLWTAPQI
ncbi:MAG: ABC-type transport auxiliary lipoprotein family protein [Methylocella sp.]